MTTLPLSAQTAENQASQRDNFMERLLSASAGFFLAYTVYMGDRLGLYRALAIADEAGLTSSELAAQTGTNERYVREWLEQQTVSGVLTVTNVSAGSLTRRFGLPAGHAEVLTDRNSLNYMAPLARLMVGVAKPIDAVMDAFRNGGGVPYEAYGSDMREGQAEINRAAFLQQLGPEWLSAIPDVAARLRSESIPARVADIGCGAGYSSLGIAQTFPNCRVDGFDLDGPSIELARGNVREARLSDRVRFYHRDAGTAEGVGQYDLAIALECIHDMSDPVAVLRSMRRLTAPNGAVIVVDERVGHHFTPEGGTDVEWMMYGWSILHCLPVGMADQPSRGTGTVMRTDTLSEYAREAGFRDIEILPIDNFFFRFYRLHI